MNKKILLLLLVSFVGNSKVFNIAELGINQRELDALLIAENESDFDGEIPLGVYVNGKYVSKFLMTYENGRLCHNSSFLSALGLYNKAVEHTGCSQLYDVRSGYSEFLDLNSQNVWITIDKNLLTKKKENSDSFAFYVDHTENLSYWKSNGQESSYGNMNADIQLMALNSVFYTNGYINVNKYNSNAEFYSYGVSTEVDDLYITLGNSLAAYSRYLNTDFGLKISSINSNNSTQRIHVDGSISSRSEVSVKQSGKVIFSKVFEAGSYSIPDLGIMNGGDITVIERDLFSELSNIQTFPLSYFSKTNGMSPANISGFTFSAGRATTAQAKSEPYFSLGFTTNLIGNISFDSQNTLSASIFSSYNNINHYMSFMSSSYYFNIDKLQGFGLEDKTYNTYGINLVFPFGESNQYAISYGINQSTSPVFGIDENLKDPFIIEPQLSTKQNYVSRSSFGSFSFPISKSRNSISVNHIDTMENNIFTYSFNSNVRYDDLRLMSSIKLRRDDFVKDDYVFQIGVSYRFGSSSQIATNYSGGLNDSLRTSFSQSVGSSSNYSISAQSNLSDSATQLGASFNQRNTKYNSSFYGSSGRNLKNLSFRGRGSFAFTENSLNSISNNPRALARVNIKVENSPLQADLSGVVVKSGSNRAIVSEGGNTILPLHTNQDNEIMIDPVNLKSNIEVISGNSVLNPGYGGVHSINFLVKYISYASLYIPSDAIKPGMKVYQDSVYISDVDSNNDVLISNFSRDSTLEVFNDLGNSCVIKLIESTITVIDEISYATATCSF